MRLFLAGGNSPTGKELQEILRRRRIRFQAPADKHFDPDNAVAVARMITEYAPTQLINLTDFISGHHRALLRAESSEPRCFAVNARLPAVLAEICDHLNVPMLHLSNAYVFDGEKRLGYNENDPPAPRGVYGRASLEGERAVRRHRAHVIVRHGWLFGSWKKGLIRAWIRELGQGAGQIAVAKRRLSPTWTGDLADALLAICRQVDCQANVWGTYHLSGLETKEEKGFAAQALKYAARHDGALAAALEGLRLVERPVRPPEIYNSTLSGKKLFDTFAIRQKSWHGRLKEVVRELHGERAPGRPPRAAPAA